MAMPELSEEEIESCLIRAKPWKATGEDGVPAGVWKQVWPAVKESVRCLFQTSLDKDLATVVGDRQDRPLKKPNKDDYTQAEAWIPISL